MLPSSGGLMTASSRGYFTCRNAGVSGLSTSSPFASPTPNPDAASKPLSPGASGYASVAIYRRNPMDSEQKFWVTVWTLAAVAFTVLCTTVMAYNLSELAALSASRDPIALRCALGGDGSAQRACMAVAARKL